jgi:membrane-associated phospholipid phosphatase
MTAGVRDRGAVSAPRSSDPRTLRLAWATVLGALLLVALLAWAVTGGAAPLLRVDHAVADALYAGDDRSPLLDGLLQVATAPGLYLVRCVLFLPVLAWLVAGRRWWTAGWVATAVLLISPLTTLLKDAVGRVRPQFAGGGADYGTLSFPSGHSSGVATLVTVGLLLAWPVLAPRARRGWLAAGLALAVLVGLTRMWLGVHWLSDVVGGEALGVGWTLLVALVFGGLPGGRAALPGRRSATAVEAGR